jgi:outer membrane protein assembly factor BamB
MGLRSGLCLLGALLSLTTTGRSGDWPGWRGPNRDDISSETGLLQSWPEGGPEKLWETDKAGLGYSGFAIVDNVLYTMGADGKESDSSEFVMALSADTGEKVWNSRIGGYYDNGWGGGPRCTPSISGDRLVAIGGQGDVVCLSVTDGSELWRNSLVELGGSIPNWGYCESPLIDGERVLVTPGGGNGAVACLNLADGKVIWQSAEVTAPAHYSSIIVVDHFGRRQYIQRTETLIFGLDENGKQVWSHGFPNGRVAVIPTPIYHKGQIYVTAGYKAGCMLLNLTADNKVEQIYENKVMQNHHGGVVLLDGYIYGHGDGEGILCQKLETGEMVWSDGKKRNESKGSVTFADGMLYCFSERGGECSLVKATPEGFSEVSRFTLAPQTTKRSDRGMIWTHPVVCNGRLYLRDQDVLCCYKIAP